MPVEADDVVPVARWVETVQRAADIAPSLWGALDGAAREVRTGHGRRADTAPAAEVRARSVAALHAVIRAVALGRSPALAMEVPVTPGVQALLHALRAAFLDQVILLADPPSPAQLVQMLRAFEAVECAMEQDATRRFVSTLSGPDGLELIVEVAHDLRSPLSSILFLAETLRKGRSGTVNAVQERQLGLVYSAALGLSAMASDVIELARGGSRLLDAHPRPFSVSDILRSVHEVVQPMAEEKGLAVRLAPPEGDFRLGHPAALNRVLLNLTTNALKFTEHGSVDVTAQQTTRTNVIFAVQDTGRGIPDDVLAILYEPFRRRRPAEYAFSSAGLGLAICRKLVAAMGARLDVDTSPDTGTRFFFELELPPASRL